MLVLDLAKGRAKGGVNSDHKYLFRYKKFGDEKWHHVYPHNKMVDEDGKLLVKPITVLRWFFGVPKPSEQEQLKGLGIKLTERYGHGFAPRGTGLADVVDEGAVRVQTGKTISTEVHPHKNITTIMEISGDGEAVELSPEDLPGTIQQFMLSADEQKHLTELHSQIKETGGHGGPALVITTIQKPLSRLSPAEKQHAELHDLVEAVEIKGKPGKYLKLVTEEVPVEAATPPKGEGGYLHVLKQDVPMSDPGVKHVSQSVNTEGKTVEVREGDIFEMRKKKWGKRHARRPDMVITSIGPVDQRVTDKFSDEASFLDEARGKVVLKPTREGGKTRVEVLGRPQTLKMTAGQFGRTPDGNNVIPHSAFNDLLKEWDRQLYWTARDAVSKYLQHSPSYRGNATRDENAGRNPYEKGSSASEYLKQRTKDFKDALSLKFVELATVGYKPDLNDSSSRFDTWAERQLQNHADQMGRKELRERGVALPSEDTISDLASSHASADEVAEYNQFAPVAATYLKEAIEDLHESTRRVIEARLWLNSEEAKHEEAKQISGRTKQDFAEEDGWVAPEGGAHWGNKEHSGFVMRDWAEIARQHTSWVNPKTGKRETWDATNPKELKRGSDLLRSWYTQGVGTLLSKFTIKTRVADAISAGIIDTPHGVVHDPSTGLYFHRKGYAVYRWLSLASKFMRTHSAPAQGTEFEPGVRKMTIPPDPARRKVKNVPTSFAFAPYFEQHRGLLSKLGISHFRKPDAIVQVYPGRPAPTVPPVSTPLAERYGLPSYHSEHMGLHLTPEQKRRHDILSLAHRYMTHLESRPDAEITGLKQRTKKNMGLATRQLADTKKQIDAMAVHGDVTELESQHAAIQSKIQEYHYNLAMLDYEKDRRAGKVTKAFAGLDLFKAAFLEYDAALDAIARAA